MDILDDGSKSAGYVRGFIAGQSSCDPAEHALLLAVAEKAVVWRADMDDGWPAEEALLAAVDALVAWREANHA